METTFQTQIMPTSTTSATGFDAFTGSERLSTTATSRYSPSSSKSRSRTINTASLYATLGLPPGLSSLYNQTQLTNGLIAKSATSKDDNSASNSTTRDVLIVLSVLVPILFIASAICVGGAKKARANAEGADSEVAADEGGNERGNKMGTDDIPPPYTERMGPVHESKDPEGMGASGNETEQPTPPRT